jgi:two-component system OmpR family sensor kinase/two-component system sensor histidine kinase BaeS
MGKKKPSRWPHPSWWDSSHWQDRENDEGVPPWLKHAEGWAGKHHQRPAWWDEEHWPGWEEGPPWWRHKGAKREWRHSDRFLFARFALAFGIFVLLGCGALGAFVAGILFLLRQGTAADSRPLGLILALIAAAVLLAIAFRIVGAFAARRLTRPLTRTMEAADAIAAGDLSARVPLAGSGDFHHFARSFNRMAEALETANRQRRELLADVAHELRTPLTVIQGNLEGLRDGIYDATPEQLDLVLDETRKLSHLVDDLRLLTLAEAGQLPLDLQPLDVPQLLADVRDAYAPLAEEAGITLVTELPASLPPLVADSQRVGQVLGNLVTNALRHTPAGGAITLGADRAADEAIRMSIADTGEGIPPEDLPRIFDRFWRGDPARARGSGAGMGLGLAIARSLVEAHGGRIWAESQVGQGTTVSCLLPLPPVRDGA